MCQIRKDIPSVPITLLWLQLKKHTHTQNIPPTPRHTGFLKGVIIRFLHGVVYTETPHAFPGFTLMVALRVPFSGGKNGASRQKTEILGGLVTSLPGGEGYCEPNFRPDGVLPPSRDDFCT